MSSAICEGVWSAPNPSSTFAIARSSPLDPARSEGRQTRNIQEVEHAPHRKWDPEAEAALNLDPAILGNRHFSPDPKQYDPAHALSLEHKTAGWLGPMTLVFAALATV